MLSKELIQENQYQFPYHHLTYEEGGVFYLFRHLFWGLEHYTYIQYVIQEVSTLHFSRLLDVGCGEGRIISELENITSQSELHGIDISKKAIRFAEAFNNRSTFSVHDITSEPTQDIFDVVISCEVIEHIEPTMVPAYVSNIAKSLTQGGHFIVTTPTTNVPVNKKHYQHFTKDMFKDLLAQDFTIEKIVYLNEINILSKLLSRLIANRFYISNSKFLNKIVFKIYKNNFLFVGENKGSRIFVHAVKN